MIYLKLFLEFFKIGAFTFGGGYAMLPLIQEEVTAKGWLTEEALVDFIAVSESTPGPFAVNIATYIGAETGGIRGALCATCGVVLPSFIVILIIAKCLAAFRENKIIKGCMAGLKPAVIGLIGTAVLSVGQTAFPLAGSVPSVLTDAGFYSSLVIFIVAVFFAFKKVHPIFIICASAALGMISGFYL